MAGGNGQSPTHLIRDLFERPEQYEFFQAVRILEQATQQQTSKQNLKALGGAVTPRAEAVRFRAAASRTFPSGDIANAAPNRRAVSGSPAEQSLQNQLPTPVELTVPFMGLTGPNGVLPDHYTSLVIDRSHQKTKDHALREFFDLFNHRAITLFYLAWRKHRICEEYQRFADDGHDGEDRFTAALFSLTGLGVPHLRQRFSFNDELILYYGGLFARPFRSAIGLKQILSDFLKLPVAIREFSGRWIYLPTEVQSAMPSPTQLAGQNLCLGMDAVAGSQAWDEQSAFRVVIGPLNREQFLHLLPGTVLLKALEELIRFYAGSQLDFDIQLILRAQEIPACTLSGDTTCRPCLGWTTWLGTARMPVDSDDAVFRFSGIP
ncbi:MAG: type VI secretion system baseplate subunit TssG [Planctomycetaceae bacterium]|nr:type VI secretion system baseplate subunit TssG [Planctomycetaceae bacterium]